MRVGFLWRRDTQPQDSLHLYSLERAHPLQGCRTGPTAGLQDRPHCRAAGQASLQGCRTGPTAGSSTTAGCVCVCGWGREGRRPQNVNHILRIIVCVCLRVRVSLHSFGQWCLDSVALWIITGSIGFKYKRAGIYTSTHTHPHTYTHTHRAGY